MPAPPPLHTRAAPLVVSRLRLAVVHPREARAVGIAYARHLSQSTPEAEPTKVSPKTEGLSTVSTWFWRGVYVAAGAGATGAVATYVADPDGTRSYVNNMREDVEARIRFFTEPSRTELLPDQTPPYPGAPPVRTLVLDLDKTLVFSSYSRQTGWRVAKRPGAEAFLAYMASFYEIVVFTSNLNSYADPILDKLDPNFYVQHRLYRAETHYRGGVHVKDLSHLNRDLSRVVLVDNNEKHFSLQPENAILVPEWSGDPSDTTLLDLIPFLEGLVKEDVPDVREALSTLKGKRIAEGVAEYKALAATRAEQGAGRSGSLFGHAPVSEAAAAGTVGATSTGADGEAATGAVWGSLSKSSKIFHRSGDQPAQGGE